MERGGKLGYMDGLRGVAAGVVVLHHFALAFHPEFVAAISPLTLLFAGHFAVCIFFCISGFVLSYKFFETGRGEVVTSGAVRRYFRLMPLVLTAVMISYLLLRFGLYHNFEAAAITHSQWLTVSWNQPAPFFEAVRTGLYEAFATGNPVLLDRYDNVLWTMNIEFIGSLLVFAVLGLFGKMERRWIVYLILVVLLRHTYYLAFVLGQALCDWVVLRRRAGLQVGNGWLGAFALAQGLSLGALEGVTGPRAEILGATLVLCGVVMLAPAQRVLTLAPARYLGRVSFALYVVHILVIASVGGALFVVLAGPLGFVGAVAISFLLSLGVIMAMSELLTRYVDEPAIRLSGALYRRLFARGGTAAGRAPGTQEPATTTEPVAVA
jgi:peptidoglycan/LPS O-acetylase OafA/YrhL